MIHLETCCEDLSFITRFIILLNNSSLRHTLLQPHFTILRELVSFGGKKEADKPERSEGQKLLDAQSTRNMAAASAINPHDEWVYGKPLQALNVSVLRDYLFNEFKCLQSALPFGFDFERIVDDFVFLCFFVGNI